MYSRPRSRLNHVFLLLLLLVQGACAAVKSRTLPSPVTFRKEETLPPQLRAENEDAWEGKAYRVGAGDSLLVAVYGHPELALGQYSGNNFGAGGTGLARSAGFLIDNDGTAQFPLLGTVKVAGKTTAELKTFLEKELAQFVKDPHVTVQVLSNGSLRFHLLGQFSSPGMKFSDRPVRLLEAISLGGSVMLDKASLRTAYIVRGNQRLPVNFRRLLREGDVSQNIRMQTGDVVVVPDNASEQAFVFGASTSPTAVGGGAIPFRSGRLTLLQALASAGFGVAQRVQSRLSKTLVIRSEGDRGQLFVVNARKILKGQAADFELEPGDVVYVPITAWTSWNQALAQLLPTLQTVAGLLTPYVQIQYLRDANNE